ncbi:MAG: hypothetical protein K9G48_12780, partial [Reyranella sp.]|nr:hypothetical protein [Reyranella sp.]
VIAAGICIPVARAVERPARYEITLLFPGHAYDEVRRTHMVLSVDGKPLEYESRESCRIAITRVKVELKGVRLQCNPVEALRVWR